jgi:acyl-coenzyme A thioesterase PaaI-like protein
MPSWKMTKATWSIRLFALAKIPMIALVRPKIIQADAETCVVKIPLSWVVKNHLRTMYFGALCVGADMAGGLIVMNLIRARQSRVTFLFKDFQAQFLKRAEGNCFFACHDGKKLAALLDKAEASGEREEDTVEVVATVPDKLQDEPVAVFTLTISMKKAKGSPD